MTILGISSCAEECIQGCGWKIIIRHGDDCLCGAGGSFSASDTYRISQYILQADAHLYVPSSRPNPQAQQIVNYRLCPLQLSNKGLSFSEMKEGLHIPYIVDSTRLLINMLFFNLYLLVPSLENSLIINNHIISKDNSIFRLECNILYRLLSV